MKGRETAAAPDTVGSAPEGQPFFATTHWSVVLAAANEVTPDAAAALERLCRTYWYPLYAYVRRRGYSAEDAQDLTQEFFARFLERESFSLADPTRGRFRTFLLRSLQNFLADDWKRAHRTKRGGGAFVFSLDADTAEAHYVGDLTEPLTPERAFEERWALTLLEQVLARMHEDYARVGKARLFEALQDLLWGADVSTSYALLAEDLAMTEGSLRVAVHRLRADYRERLRAEVAHTVSDPGEVDAELRYLIRVISGQD
jgi:RNA polymerase sigma-70 factor (ECF subfamily)